MLLKFSHVYRLTKKRVISEIMPENNVGTFYSTANRNQCQYLAEHISKNKTTYEKFEAVQLDFHNESSFTRWDGF